MKKITKLLLTVALCALTIIAAGCGGDNKAADKKADPNAPVKIGVTAGPHAEIMDNVKKLAEKQGLKIEVVEFSDYVTPNVSLALLVLADKGFIEVKDKNDVSTSVASITKNPKNYKIQELDAASIPKAMGDLDIAVINANYALVAKLNPSKDSLLVERADNPFVNIFVTTKANEKDPRMEQLKKIYTSAENKKFIEDHFKGSITPAF